jgi:hypothetical protein
MSKHGLMRRVGEMLPQAAQKIIDGTNTFEYWEARTVWLTPYIRKYSNLLVSPSNLLSDNENAVINWFIERIAEVIVVINIENERLGEFQVALLELIELSLIGINYIRDKVPTGILGEKESLE